jgi:hypothetical protein
VLASCTSTRGTRVLYTWIVVRRRAALLPTMTCGPLLKDGFGSDAHGYEFECHYLPYFISNSDTNMNIIEYEYKTDISNSDSNTYSIYSIES